MDDYKADRRGEHLWKQRARREEVRKKKVNGAPSAEEERESFFALISPHLSSLNGVVRHLIGFAEARGDLIPDEVTAEDIVDATMLRAYDEFVKDPVRGNIRSWLMGLAMEQLESEVKRSRRERGRMVHTEEDIPETPPAEAVSTLGDEILDFYQPDEDLKLEDVIPDMKVSSPEDQAEREELRQCVRPALSEMPQPWRRLLLLRYVEGLPVAELAQTTGKPEPEIERILEYARQTLRERLIESGCAFTTPTTDQVCG